MRVQIFAEMEGYVDGLLVAEGEQVQAPYLFWTGVRVTEDDGPDEIEFKCSTLEDIRGWRYSRVGENFYFPPAYTVKEVPDGQGT